MKITREVVGIPKTAAGRLIDGNIGYLRIARFWPDTSAEAEAVLKNMKKSGLRGSVIDIRSNEGGLMASITETAQLFMKKRDVVVRLGGRSDGQEKELKAGKWFPYTDFPIVVLIDSKTISGAEIFAAALRDNRQAPLVGEKSAGKCDILTAFPLRDGSQLRIRTALAYSPAGLPIDGQGVKPDFEVVVPEEERAALYDLIDSFPGLDNVGSPVDTQLKAAVGILKGSDYHRIEASGNLIEPRHVDPWGHSCI